MLRSYDASSGCTHIRLRDHRENGHPLRNTLDKVMGPALWGPPETLRQRCSLHACMMCRSGGRGFDSWRVN